ncbi:polysaccharide deacetylase family protein [Candidatus Saccharibacteria bacterium]|nr:polysaccharide deacetylase family protein [Candidatus Saccharibacteria bacterium]
MKVAVLVLFVINISVLFFAAFMNSDLFIKWAVPNPIYDIPPVIILNGQEEMRIASGTEYVDPGAETYGIGSDASLVTEGEVDTSAEGVYTIKYIACDERSNCTTKERKVTVLKPTGTIYLTFDDGPGEHTDRLLDILKKHHVLATFFVTGRGADELLKREHDEGHSIGLHSFSHDYSYIYRNTANFWDDMEKVRARVKTATGEDTLLMRFPGGSSNTVSARYDGGSHIMSKLTKEATERGYTYFDWNVLSGDAGETTETDKVFENVTKSLKQGGSSVVLQHDIKGFSVDAVERIIEFGLENGYIFDKLSADSFDAHHGVNN